MFPRRLKNNRGFTLVEVIVAMAILGTVLTMAYSLLGFSRNTLSNSNDHFDIQNDIRLASSYLCDQVRFATELKIIPYSEAVTEIGAHTNYNYFYIEGGSLHQAKYIDSSTYEEHSYARYISTSESHFTGVNATTLNIALTAVQDGKNYNASTDLKLENFPLIDATHAIEGTGPDLAIRYKTKESNTTLIPVTSISISGGNAITTNKGTLALTATVLPNDASIKTVLWSVSNSSIASVGSTGVVTAIANGSVSVTATAGDGSGVTATRTVTISNQTPPAPDPVRLATDSPPDATKNTLYSFTFHVSGGTSPYTFTVTGGSLPSGLTLNSTTGVLSGTPSSNGNSHFTITVTDAKNTSDSCSYSLKVNNH